MASTLLDTLGNVSISPNVTSIPIDKALWIPSDQPRTVEDLVFPPEISLTPVICPDVLSCPSLEEIFSCIAYMETGSTMIDPLNLRLVFALCCGNSIYVARRILTDPTEEVQNHEVQHLVSNVGRPGLSFLIAPYRPEIREKGYDYRLISHIPYDSKREDNFKSTSLHLSFSNWSLPLNTDARRHIDKDVNYVESVIKVFDGTEWVADLDVMRISFNEITKLDGSCTCANSSSSRTSSPSLKQPESRNQKTENGEMEIDTVAKRNYVSLDSWEELLDPPLVTSVGMFRAHGNWAARLAAVSILTQKGQAHSIGLVRKDQTFCLRCMEAKCSENFCELGETESCLPSIRVD